MFKRDLDMDEDRSMLMLTMVSVALTVPFIFIFKDMAGSLKTMAQQRTGLARIKRYR